MKIDESQNRERRSKHCRGTDRLIFFPLWLAHLKLFPRDAMVKILPCEQTAGRLAHREETNSYWIVKKEAKLKQR